MSKSSENDIVFFLQKESEKNYFNATKTQKWTHSEISAWNDFIPETKITNSRKKDGLSPVRKRFYNYSTRSPSLVRKHAKVMIIAEKNENYDADEVSLKLPMIKGTKSPLYRYTLADDKICDMFIKTKQGEIKKNVIYINNTTPKSINSIKSPLQIVSLLNNEILRSLSSNKRKQYYNIA